MKVLTHKQRALLYTINKLSARGLSSKFMLVKNLFLLSEEERAESFIKFYHFFPYKYGPFSNSCYEDIHKLKKEGYVCENNDGLVLTNKGKEASKKADKKLKFRINRTTGRFSTNSAIRDYVYQMYPQYTIKSELIDNKKSVDEPGIFTVGYEGRDIDQFLKVLITNHIDTLIDVRKNAFSMKFSFVKNKLHRYLDKMGINYIHMPELGIEGDERKNLLTLKDYKDLFEKYKESTLINYSDKVDEIIRVGKQHRVALMCFVADVETCHRGVIAQEITERLNMDVADI